MKSEQLHRLIHGMSKAEKRFFTLFTSMYEKEGDTKIFTSIYEYLDKQAVYHEEAFLTNFEHVNSRALIQTYLADIIVNCLVLLKRGDDMAFQISLVQELIDRGFSKEAQRKINKLKPICEQQNDRKNLISLFELEIAIIQPHAQNTEKMEDILSMRKKASVIYNDLLDSSLLLERYCELHLEYTKHITQGTDNDRLIDQLSEELKPEQIAAEEALATRLGIKELEVHYNKVLLYYILKKDMLGGFNIVQKQINLEITKLKIDIKILISKYHNLLIFAINLNDDAIVASILQKIKNLEVKTIDTKTLKYYTYFTSLASYAVVKQQPALLINELDDLKNFLDSSENSLIDENALVLYSNVLACMFLSKNYSLYINWYIHLQNYKIKKTNEIYYYIKLTELFIHFKLGNHTIVQSGLLHLYRCFKDSPPTKEFIVNIYKILKRLHLNPDKKPNNYAQNILEALPPTNEDLFVTVVRAYFTDKLS